MKQKIFPILLYFIKDSTTSGTNWEIGEREAGKWQIFEDDGDSIVATFMSTGRVGIGTESPASLLHIESATNTAITIQAGTNSSASLRLKNDAVDFDVNVQTNDNFALYNHTYNKQPITVTPQGYMTLQHEGSDFGLQIRTNGSKYSPCIFVFAILSF